MSKRLEERIKNCFPNHRLNDKRDFQLHQFSDEDMIDFAENYAREVAQASLERASEKVVMNYHDGHHKTNTPMTYVQFGADNIKVQKESITNPENIIL